MGARFSRNTVEEPEHDEWGSDIDEQFCGPGKICGDNWTPLSLTPEPESELDLGPTFDDGRNLDLRTSPEPITHQPLGTSYDSFILPEDPQFPKSPEVQEEILVPMKRSKKKDRPRPRAEPKKRKPKLKPKPKTIHVIIDIDNSQRIERTIDITKDQNPIRIRHVSKTSKIHHVPVKILSKPARTSKGPIESTKLQKIPKVLPPSPYKVQDQEDIRFIQKHRSEIVYTRAVPPNRLKGMKIDPPDPFRVRRVS